MHISRGKIKDGSWAVLLKSPCCGPWCSKRLWKQKLRQSNICDEPIHSSHWNHELYYILWVFKNLRTCRVWMVLIKGWRCCEWWLSSFKGLLFSKRRQSIAACFFLKRQEAHPKQQQMFGPRNRIVRSPLNKQIGYPLWDVTEPACSILPAWLLLYFFFFYISWTCCCSHLC